MPVSTYHCVCSELTLATTLPLADLPKRQCDGAFICKLATAETLTQGASILTNAVFFDSKPVVLKLEDGFEKRYPAKCERCGLVLGYQLDLGHFEETKEESGRRDGVIYVIPGGVLETEEMVKGKG